MDPALIQAVQQSLGRCLLNERLGKGFLDAFYDEFLTSDPRIKPMFAKTDMKKQKDLLRQGLMTLLMYAKKSPLATSAIKQLAAKHSRQQLNVPPQLYPLWKQSLLKCIDSYDLELTPQLRKDWSESLDSGIEAMKAAY
jgi:hemoglobin-like flavoprotein